MAKKNTPIKYTSREFESIKNDLTDHAKRYYADTFKDFNSTSFGSMMLDSVAYVGDILSFYLDYQANESFLDTAIEYDNVLKHGQAMGFKLTHNAASTVKITFFVSCPANSNGQGPDQNYLPILKRGSVFSSESGLQFTLIDDVDFSSSDTDIVVQSTDAAGTTPTYYAIKTVGRAVSGELAVATKSIGSFVKFREVIVQDPDITEIVQVIDSEGNEYYEVENLAQNVIYTNVRNTSSDSDYAPSILKPIIVPRRFTTSKNLNRVVLQFGHGSEVEPNKQFVADPSEIALDLHGKDYVSNTSFDPAKLVENDKFGVAPVNTTLIITYRRNPAGSDGVQVNSINSVVQPIFEFTSPATLSESEKDVVVGSLEITNEESVGGSGGAPNMQELKMMIKGHFSSQNRAVTQQDYIALAYNMPPQFGGIKRAVVMKDVDSFKRNLNMYVVSENFSGKLIKTTDTTKQNLKTWVNQYKMINDTIDILDAKILNLKLDFVVFGEDGVNQYDLLSSCVTSLISLYDERGHFGIAEPLSISEIYRTLNAVPGVVDTFDVTVSLATGTGYSDVFLDVENFVTSDGQKLIVPEDFIIEIKDLVKDIKGSVR